MSNARPLSDEVALRRNRAKARQNGWVGFLHEEAFSEIQERLIDVNRAFTRPAIVTGAPEFWQEMMPEALVVPDEDVLKLDPQAHDLVIHAMSMHWASDPVGQLIQCKRALAPDGLFLGVMFGGQTLHELRSALAEAEVAVTGGLSPRIAPMGEIRELGGLIGRAGLALPVADNLVQTVSYADPMALLRDLRGMGETNSLSSRSRKFAPRHLFPEMTRIYVDQFGTQDGRIPATFELVFLTGWAPSETQQQPLKPGTATTRLADFLNTTELGQDAQPVKGDKD